MIADSFLPRIRDDLRRVRADAACPIVRRDAEVEIIADGWDAFDGCLGVVLPRRGDERFRDAKHRVRIDMGVIGEVKRGDQFAVAFRADQEVDMGRAIPMPVWPSRACRLVRPWE